MTNVAQLDRLMTGSAAAVRAAQEGLQEHHRPRLSG